MYLILSIISEGLISFLSYWLGFIGDPNKFTEISCGWKIGLYAILSLLMCLFQILRALISGIIVERTNRIIHNRLVKHVIHCPNTFFDATPRVVFLIDSQEIFHILINSYEHS